MREVTSCEFNMDTACVELHFSDGSTVVAISTIAVENEVARRVCIRRSELDSADLRSAKWSALGSSSPAASEEYLKGSAEHRLAD